MAQIREIDNIFSRLPDFCCFACCPTNEIGLKLKFFFDEETGEAFSRFTPEERLSGFPGVLHGGIQTTLLDELAFWAVFEAHRVMVVTAEISVRFLESVPTETPLEIRARAEPPRRRLARVEARLGPPGAPPLTEARITTFVSGREAWAKRLGGTIPQELIPYIPER